MCNRSFRVEVDQISPREWTDLIKSFLDAYIYHAWTSSEGEESKRRLSHLILRDEKGVAAMAQVKITKVPLIGRGVATSFWYPLWKRKGETNNLLVLDRMLDALKREYVIKRKLLLRLWPIAFDDCDDGTRLLLSKHGFRYNQNIKTYRTLILDLVPSIDSLRKNLNGKWRNQLNASEKNNLQVEVGSSDELFSTCLNMLEETISRKGFTPQVNFKRYRALQRCLPADLKMKIFVCKHSGSAVSCGIYSAIGETGLYLLGATANNGLRLYGSNLIQWLALKWLKGIGCSRYDLGGIDPVRNAGVYHFKRGIAGKSGWEVSQIGQYYLTPDSIGYLLNQCIDLSNTVRNRLRRK